MGARQNELYSGKMTFPAVLSHTCERYPDRPSLNFVESEGRTYRDMMREVRAVAAYLCSLGVTKGSRVAFLSAGMPTYGIAEWAVYLLGGVCVPIIPGFSSAQIEHLLTHAEVTVVFVSRLYIKQLIGINPPLLQHILYLNSFKHLERGRDYTPADLEALPSDVDLSAEVTLPEVEVEEHDLASIIYTSGTTGFSKGVMLSHKNIIWNAVHCGLIQPINSSDRFLSILPLAHTYENTLGLVLPVMYGAAVYYLDRPPTTSLLVPAMQKIHPTVMLSVPLIMEKIYKTQIRPRLSKRWIMRILMRFPWTRKMLHRVAGKQLYATFGGQLKFFGIGGAKLDSKVERFLYEGHFPYAVGYGLTETSPMSAGEAPYHTFLYGVGRAMPGVELRIENPNLLGDGEVLIRGPHVMMGYYKEPVLTAQSLTADGWYRSGDLGRIDRKGRLTLRGRLKTMILGPSGENIYPEEIESVINDFYLVDESMVVGEEGKLIAKVYFNMEKVEEKYKAEKASGNNSPIDSLNEFLEERRRELREFINSRVSVFSKVARVDTQQEPFEKTPTLKIKRTGSPSADKSADNHTTDNEQDSHTDQTK